MSSDSLKDRREQSLLDRIDRRTVGIVVVVAAVVAVGAAAVLVMGGGGDDGGGNDGGTAGEGLNLIPQDVDGVVQINGSVTEDELILETLDGGNDGEEVGALNAAWWIVDEGKSPSLDEILSLIGDDSIGYEKTTAFFKSDTETAYAGATVEVEENASALVGLVEDEVGSLDETEYSNVTIHQINAQQAAQQANVTDEYDLTGLLTQFIGNDTQAGVATLDDETAVLGSRAAVEDVIDISQDNAEPVSPDSEFRTAHDRAPDGEIKLTVDVSLLPEEASLAELAFVIDEDIGAGLDLAANRGEDITYLSGAYNPRDREAGTATLHAQAMADDTSVAEDLIGLFETRVGKEALSTVKDDPESIMELPPSERAKATQEGRYVDLEIPEMPGRVIGYIADIVDQFGSEFADHETSALVPQAANDLQQVDDPQAENVDVDNATTFQGEGDYVGTVVELSDSESLLDEISAQTDGELSQRDEEYRMVTVHELSGSEPAVTESLSGEATANTEWVAPIGGNFVVFGTQQAVQDSIDIYRGVAAVNQG
jgi:hypothetical protein